MQSGKVKQSSTHDGVIATSSEQSSRKSKKAAAAREIDVSRAGRGVWLMKIPNYLASAWRNGTADTELGTIRIGSNADSKKLKVDFSLAKELASTALDGQEVPCDHKVVMQDSQSQCLCLFSEDSSGQLVAEGKVLHRADIQPTDSSVYMKLKRHQIELAEKTKFTAQALEKTPASVYKPKASHKEYDEHKQKQKELGKRAREDRETVLDLLFTAFQQHQYYNFKDLVVKTKQPPTYLKEILREVATYNTKQPHKNMWELKPEYRHYKKTKTEES
ncbi:hypothetical protein EMCRGX_G026136 [Ephydatia muelleri]